MWRSGCVYFAGYNSRILEHSFIGIPNHQKYATKIKNLRIEIVRTRSLSTSSLSTRLLDSWILFPVSFPRRECDLRLYWWDSKLHRVEQIPENGEISLFLHLSNWKGTQCHLCAILISVRWNCFILLPSFAIFYHFEHFSIVGKYLWSGWAVVAGNEA